MSFSILIFTITTEIHARSLIKFYFEDSFNSNLSDVLVISYFSTAEIGGQVGLCVGASLLTVLEFCDVMLAIIGIRLGFR